jgi:hypothetical protein
MASRFFGIRIWFSPGLFDLNLWRIGSLNSFAEISVLNVPEGNTYTPEAFPKEPTSYMSRVFFHQAVEQGESESQSEAFHAVVTHLQSVGTPHKAVDESPGRA